MEEKKKNKIVVSILIILTVILICMVLYQQTIISQSPNYFVPSDWLCDGEIETGIAKIDLTVDFTDTNIAASVYGTAIIPVNYTGSMEPVMFGGNQLIVLNITNKDLIMPGDIIGFKAENKNICHRVIEKDYIFYENTYEPVFRTKGDNCTKMDPWIIKSNDIFGVVVGILY